MLFSAAIYSGKGCVVIVGLAVENATLLAYLSGLWRRLAIRSWLHGTIPILRRKGQLGMCSFFTA